MKLYLKNIGKISEANVEINGITVIGEKTILEKAQLENHCFPYSVVFTKFNSRSEESVF